MSFRDFMHKLPVKIVCGACAVLTPFIWMMSREFHFFFDFFPGFSYVVLALTILVAAYELVYLYPALLCKTRERKALRVIYYVCAFLGVITLIGFSVIIGVLAPQMSRNVFYKELPYLCIVGVIILLAFAAAWKNAKITAALAVCALVATLLVGILVPLAHASSFKFEATPAVFDRGDHYLVVWATNVNSVGKIEYSYGGENYVVYDEIAGRINLSESIHSVVVPKEHLDNNSYTVSSSKVLKNVAYGSQTGKTISFTATFSPVKSDDFDLLIITDNHNIKKSWYDKFSIRSAPSAVVMLGDFADMISDEKTIVDCLLYPSAKFSEGKVPVIYAKGNHDNRGERANDLSRIFRTEKFYYVTELGGYRFAVLDSGESNLDGLKEYGYACFDEYRKTQLAEIDAKLTPDKKNMVVVHDPVYAPDLQTSGKFYATIKNRDVKLVLSGHTHEFLLNERPTEAAAHSLVCGGVTPGESLVKTDFVYSLLTFENDTVNIEAFSVKKGKTFEKRISL